MKQCCPALQNYYPEEKHTTPIVQFLSLEAPARTFRVSIQVSSIKNKKLILYY